MATYINYGEGEEDATVQVAEWLRGIIAQLHGEEAQTKFTEKFKELHTTDDRRYDYGPVFGLLVENSKDIFSYIPETRNEEKIKEVESFFALIFSMLLLLEDDEQLDNGTKNLCQILSSETTQAELRLRLLMLLYNTFNMPTFEYRYRVFKHIVDFAAKASLFDQVVPYLEYIDAWMADWEKHISVEEKRVLYRDLSGYMSKLNKRLDAFQFLRKYHILHQGETTKLGSEEVTSMTVQLLKSAVQLPAVMQFDDLLAFDTVKALAKSKKAGSDLVELCEIFLSGTVQGLRDFESKNSKLFKEHDLSLPDCMAKIKLLTLATMVHGNSEMDLKAVAKGIEEQEENVEPWVVRAISEGIIDGRIDQLNHKLLCKSAFQRKFEKEEWAFLDTKLSQWVGNLEHVIKFIEEQKTNAPA